MRFVDDLYVSDYFDRNNKRFEHMLQTLRNGDVKDVFYVIYKNYNCDTPEFMQSLYFRQKYFQSLNISIIGIVKTKKEALRFLAEYICHDKNVILSETLE